MYFLANAMQMLALGVSALCALLALWNALKGVDKIPAPVRFGHIVVCGAFTFSSATLLKALYARDYSLDYVAGYTDEALELFYRLTAFWAGQPGSMLFWALSVSAMVAVFSFTDGCRRLSARTGLWFWSFVYTILAFFSLLLLVWNNPFLQTLPAPADGHGLNPLLQNPGMIIHPPLLFLGYGGFAIPSALALAQAIAGKAKGEQSWHVVARPWNALAWSFLTAGIMLGAWWAYMELGWGGYWAWDPVENASLLPWLFATATMHTLAVERRRGKLSRFNVFSMSLTTISGFFATYLVRSGVVDSVHAFGQNAVGTPLLLFVLGGVLVSLVAALLSDRGREALSSPVSREGALLFTSWLFLALGCIILLATLWPVISKLWSSAPQGLDASFYNRVCLPLGAALVGLLALCPWLLWEGGVQEKKGLVLCALLGCVSTSLSAFLGYTRLLPLVSTALSVAGLAACLWLAISKARGTHPGFSLGAVGTHAGLALCALAVAFSGPYKLEDDISLAVGKSSTLGSYTITLESLTDGRRIDHAFLQAKISVTKDGEPVGVLLPERRIYEKFTGMRFTEVDTVPSLGNELYASLSGMEDDEALIKISVEPLVNWLWIGGALMTLFPLLLLRRPKAARP